MISFIGRTIRVMFLLFILLVTMPTLIFLIKAYYSNLVAKKSYIGVIDLPSYVMKSDDIIHSARTLFRAPQIKAVIIKVDGEGGNAGACEAVYHDLVNLKKSYQKPLIAYAETKCARGAYLIGLAADSFIATTVTRFEDIGLFDQNPGEEHERSRDLHLDYKKTIFEKKAIEAESISFMGHVLTGQYAYEKGLIDHLGSATEVERALRNLTVIEGRIEEVHGSLIQHFVSSSARIMTTLFKAVKQAWHAV